MIAIALGPGSLDALGLQPWGTLRLWAAGGQVDTKAVELYEYLRSADFRERLQAIFGSVERLRKLQEQEQRAHRRHWEKESKEHGAIHEHVSAAEARISAITEGRVIRIPVPDRQKKRKRTLAEEIEAITRTKS